MVIGSPFPVTGTHTLSAELLDVEKPRGMGEEFGPRLLDVLVDVARLADHRHEGVIPAPPRDDVDVEVVVESGTGNSAEVQADVHAVWIEDLPEKAFGPCHSEKEGRQLIG